MKLILTLSFLAFPFTQLLHSQSESDNLIKIQNAGNEIDVYIKTPAINKPKGVIIVLPGWKLPVLDWCTKTSLCQKALAEGYILIMPEMAKSIYANLRYSETRKDWLKFATRTWFKDTLISYFQKNYKLLLPGQNNFVLGLSTGARGVALLCLDLPDIFKKGAGLSGDYDQTQMPNDALMKGWYGTITSFPERWKGEDNIVYRIKELKTPLYLSHGSADKIVPVNQTLQLIDSLKKYNPSLISFNINDTAGHTYDYWNSEVNAVLKFFSEKY
jgi:S-formylglutathione hydrolase FrmB